MLSTHTEKREREEDGLCRTAHRANGLGPGKGSSPPQFGPPGTETFAVYSGGSRPDSFHLLGCLEHGFQVREALRLRFLVVRVLPSPSGPLCAASQTKPAASTSQSAGPAPVATSVPSYLGAGTVPSPLAGHKQDLLHRQQEVYHFSCCLPGHAPSLGDLWPRHSPTCSHPSFHGFQPLGRGFHYLHLGVSTWT